MAAPISKKPGSSFLDPGFFIWKDRLFLYKAFEADDGCG